MASPFISILTPVYNGVEFLEECLTSVCNQTYTDWDMWIGVNGHGPDGGEVLATVRRIVSAVPLEVRNRIHVRLQPPPLKGKVESLNDLMQYVRGEWIALLDCDDVWDPHKLEIQVRTLKEEGRHAAVLGTFCRYFGTMGGSPHLPAGYIDPTILGQVNPLINSSALVHRSLARWRYTDICYGMEDYDLWMRISLAGGKLYNVPYMLVGHRIHPTSAFNAVGQDPKRLQEQYREWSKHIGLL